ncbi:MAG: ketoacyl-ACP synthase III [candidate division KSB1 bacterium]|nr:ketoacyl-ACP synthase III [candidate division KSB1 bacterium]MDZ7318916.1 ketoacyl-ACP synthase III [candidate division KSB1 bacterium]MDZ7342364.1 ketoacyl-ACP synthase III [candidate division KSB1 bacterium]
MITGLGFAVPKQILTNGDLEKLVDTSDEWIKERTGMVQRYVCDAATATSDLGTEAAKKALAAAKLKPKDIDIIIVATVTGDTPFPATACYVQKNLGAINAAAFDISAACSGFLYGLTIANNLIAAGEYKNVLVIGAEALTKITDYTDRTTCVLFGDGAGAAVLQPSDGQRGIMKTLIKSDGRLTDLLYMPGGGSRQPASHETIDQRLHYIKMQGTDVFKYAVKAMGDAAVDILKMANIKSSQLTLLIPHQANVRIIEATARRIKLPMEKVFINIDRYGNTSAASIPIALTEAMEQNRLQPGDYCLMVSFGGGFTTGAVLVKI